MKTSTLFGASLLATATTACIVVHTYEMVCPGIAQLIGGDEDIMKAEMYDNGELVCSGTFSKRTSSSDWFPIPGCNNGYSLQIGGDGNANKVRKRSIFTKRVLSLSFQNRRICKVQMAIKRRWKLSTRQVILCLAALTPLDQMEVSPSQGLRPKCVFMMGIGTVICTRGVRHVVPPGQVHVDHPL
jgi:hypothetical protein